MSRKFVIPGEILGDGMAGQNTFTDDGKVRSKVMGFAENRDNKHFVITVNGVYNPKTGDGIVGMVDEVSFSKWIVEINAPYIGVLSLSDGVDEFVDLAKTELTKYFDRGDYIFAEILSVSKNKNIQLSMKSRKCRKLVNGRFIKIVPSKVPRIIGKSGSMVEMIKNLTGTQIVVGQNGIVWVKGENDDVAINAVMEIEKNAHTDGLTDKIKVFIEENMKDRSKGDSNE